MNDELASTAAMKGEAKVSRTWSGDRYRAPDLLS